MEEWVSANKDQSKAALAIDDMFRGGIANN